MAFGADVANLIVMLKLDDSGFTGKLNNAARTLGRMDQGLGRVGRGAGQLGSGLSRLGTVAVATAAAGLGAVVGTAVSFEDAFAGVRKTVDASDEDLDILMDTFREMARTIPVSFEVLAGIGEQAGALGIATSAIDEFTEVVALLGETTDLTTEDAATALGTLANVLNLREEDFDNFGSALVDLGNKGASTESQILGIAQRAGSGATLIGLSADATLGWASSLANLGIEVEAGGSALQKFFLESLRNIQDDDTLALMAETAGTTGEAFKQAFEEDASGALSTFIDGLGDLSKAEQLAVLKGLGFTDIRITRALLGLAGDADALTESLDISADAFADNTALQTEAAKRFETTRSKLDLLIGNLRDVAFVIGNEVIPIVADLSTDFVNFLNEPGTQEGIRDFAKNLAGGIRDLARELKGTDFSGVIGGMQIAAGIAKSAFDAFRALPQPIQQLAIAALVANKVSGGAVGLIAKGLANIAFGGLQAGIAGIFGGRGSTPANPLFVSAIGGGLGGAGGAAGAGGRGGGLLGTAAKWVLGPVAAVIIGAEIAKAINEKTITPALEFEQEQFTAVLDSEDTDRLVSGLSAIEQQWEDADLGETAAMLISHVPLIGDALGNVGPKLDEQKRLIRDQLLAQGYTNEQIDAMVYAQEQGNERDAIYDGKRGGEADKLILTQADLIQEAKQNRTSTTVRLDLLAAKAAIASSTASGKADNLLAEISGTTGAVGVVAGRVVEARDRLGVSNAKLGTIAAKDWSAEVNLNQIVNVSATLSASQAAASIAISNSIKGQNILGQIAP